MSKEWQRIFDAHVAFERAFAKWACSAVNDTIPNGELKSAAQLLLKAVRENVDVS